VTVTNSGRHLVRVADVKVTGDGFTNTSKPSNIGPGQTQQITLTVGIVDAEMRQYVVGMNRFEQFMDVLGVALATLAIALSLLTVLLQRRQHQRDAYRQIYESLMSDALQRGRWLINDVAATGVMPEDPADVRLMYRTLGTFDNLAMYIRHRLVPRTWVMDVWHHPLREMQQGSEIVRAARETRSGIPTYTVPWPQLWQLFGQAELYRSDLPCCSPTTGVTNSHQ